MSELDQDQIPDYLLRGFPEGEPPALTEEELAELRSHWKTHYMKELTLAHKQFLVLQRRWSKRATVACYLHEGKIYPTLVLQD